jgi:conjugal transfer pilus assembly protein TraA
MDPMKQNDVKKPVVKAIDKAVLFLAAMFGAALAWAGQAGTDDPFGDFLTTVEDWASGALGTGIAITSVIFGAVRAVGNNNPMSALAGLALASFIHWGPGIIKDLVLEGSVLIGA